MRQSDWNISGQRVDQEDEPMNIKQMNYKIITVFIIAPSTKHESLENK